MGEILYKENNKTLDNKLFISLLVVLSGCLVYGFFHSALIFIVGLIGPIWLAAYWGIGFYSKMELTDELLRTGRGDINVKDIDMAFGIKSGLDVISKEDIEILRYRAFGIKKGPVILQGGAYGRKRIKVEWIALRLYSRPGKTLLFAVRDKDQFKQKLLKLLN